MSNRIVAIGSIGGAFRSYRWSTFWSVATINASSITIADRTSPRISELSIRCGSVLNKQNEYPVPRTVIVTSSLGNKTESLITPDCIIRVSPGFENRRR